MSQLLQNIDQEKLYEMAMVDIAYEVLREQNRPYNFRELMGEIAALRNMKEEQVMSMIAQIYTEVNIDGRFVCLGENTWGLKRWYPTETVEESQEGGKKKKIITDDFDDDFDMDDELEEVFEEEDDLVVFGDDEEFLDDEVSEDEDEDDDLEEELAEELEEEELFEEELADEEIDEESEED